MFPFICSSPVSHSYYYCQSFFIFWFACQICLVNLTLIKPIQLHIFRLLFSSSLSLIHILHDILKWFGSMFLSPPHPPPVTLFPYTFPSLYIPLPHTSLPLPPSSPPALSTLFIIKISFALVMQQTAEARSPSVKKFRDHITSVINDKHQPIITKSGGTSNQNLTYR